MAQALSASDDEGEKKHRTMERGCDGEDDNKGDGGQVLYIKTTVLP